jgi:hypothetical protein
MKANNLKQMKAPSCRSGKRLFITAALAEDALLEAWANYQFTEANGPRSIYQCDECGNFHFTSKGEMNTRLAKALSDGSIKRQRDANLWQNKWKRF